MFSSTSSDVTAARSKRLLRRLFLVTFVESFGTILLERGVYFFTRDLLGFSERDNLWLALAFGGTYVLGALSSHALSLRVGERRLVLVGLLLLLCVHLGLSQMPNAPVIIATFPLIGFLQGLKWPIVESFISAGRTPADLLRVLARFNTTWAVAVPLAMVASGALIEWTPGSLFAAAAVLNVVALFWTSALPPRPEHLDIAHAERPTPVEVVQLERLLGSARWAMLQSYALLFLLAPLMPGVLARLGLSLAEATSAAGVLDVSRVACFALLGAFTGWRGRSAPLIFSVLALPFGFFAILFGSRLSLVIAGEVLFGFASGLAYSASLYYALLVKNASVHAGGTHEGLVGLGFALGPIAGLLGHALMPFTGNYMAAMLTSVLPLVVLTGLKSLPRLLRSR